MNEIKSFTFYNEYAELIDNLSTEDEKKDILLAIFNYVFNDVEPELKGMSKAIFKNLKRPIEISKNRSKASLKYWNDKQEDIQTDIQTVNQKDNQTTIQTDKHIKDVYVNVNVKNNIVKDRGAEKEKEEEEKKKIIETLNSKLGTRYKTNSKNTQTKLNARLNEGYKLDDFIAVIDKKVDEWKETEFERYLCPDTLFGTKFEKYLNQKIVDRPIGKEKNGKKFQNYFQREYDNLDEFYDDL